MNKHEKPGYFWGQLLSAAVPAAIGAFGAASAASSQADAARATNATNKAALEYTKSVNAPIVEGGKEILDQYDFDPFIKYKLEAARRSGGLGDVYGAQTGRGQFGLDRAANVFTQYTDPNEILRNRLAGANTYAFNPYREQVLDRNIQDIERAHGSQDKEKNARRAKINTFLSTATAKGVTLSDIAKSEDIQKYITNERMRAYETGIERSTQDQDRQIQAAKGVGDLGTQFFNLAGMSPSAYGAASDYGTAAPFDPLLQYANITAGRNKLPTYETKPIPSAFGAGLGGALQGASAGLGMYKQFGGSNNVSSYGPSTGHVDPGYNPDGTYSPAQLSQLYAGYS